MGIACGVDVEGGSNAKVYFPIFQIHGDRDRILPPGRMRPDRIIPGGGHVLSLTHAGEVNRFIAESLDRIETGAATGPAAV